MCWRKIESDATDVDCVRLLTMVVSPLFRYPEIE
jgi:hypothetical protein